MPSKEISVAARAEMMRHNVIGRARAIEDYLGTLEKTVLPLLAKGGPEKELVLLCIRSIRADVNSLANKEERDAQA